MLRALFLKTSQQFTEKSPVKPLLQTISYKTACNFSVISHQLPFNSSELWCKFPQIRYFLSNEYLCSILKEMKHKVYYKEKDKVSQHHEQKIYTINTAKLHQSVFWRAALVSYETPSLKTFGSLYCSPNFVITSLFSFSLIFSPPVQHVSAHLCTPLILFITTFTLLYCPVSLTSISVLNSGPPFQKLTKRTTTGINNHWCRITMCSQRQINLPHNFPKSSRVSQDMTA